MKFVLISILFFIIPGAMACEGTSNRHTNPDGTIGGLVALTARVDSTVFIAYDAQVCDFARVENFSKILDSAIVKGLAWIRGHVELRHNSEIEEEATLEGTFSAKVIVNDYAKIYGKSRILPGTIVSGRSLIYDQAEVINSQIKDASICGTKVIRNKSVYDNRFCFDQLESSDATIFLKNFNTESVNTPKKKIEVGISEGELLTDISVLRVEINGLKIPTENVLLSHEKIVILNDSYLKDGLNSLKISTVDDQTLSIYEEFDFYVGSESKVIAVPDQDDDSSFRITYVMKGKDYSAPFYYSNGELLIQGLGKDISIESVKIEATSKKSFIYETYNFDEIPETISSTAIPVFISNDPFKNGETDWSISHPEYVEITNSSMAVSEAAEERIEILKTFSLASISSVSAIFEIPYLSNLLISSGPEVEVLYISRDERKITSSRFSKQFFIQNSIHSLGFSKRKSSFVTLVIRVSSSNKSSFTEPVLHVKDFDLNGVGIEFNPKNFTSKNIKLRTRAPIGFERVPDTNVSTDEGCRNPVFNFSHANNTEYQKSVLQPLTYFSVGPLNRLSGKVEHNRIFGELHIAGIDDAENISKAELIVKSNNSPVATQLWSHCAQKGLVKEIVKTPENKEITQFSFTTGNNIVNYVFAIPFSSLSWGTSESSYVQGNVISLSVKLTYFKNKLPNTKPDTKEIDVAVNLPILVSTNVGASAVEESGIDTYDSSEASYLRTGGDKWAEPAYANKIIDIVNIDSAWLVNDISKLNGGSFGGHEGHSRGADIDFKHKPIDSIRHDFYCYASDDDKWKSSLDEIEKFITSRKNQLGFIKDILISREGKRSTAFGPCSGKEFIPKWIDRKFHARCIGDKNEKGEYFGRYIDLNEKEGNWGKSIFKHYTNHHHHIHVTLNSLSGSQVNEFNPSKPEFNPSHVQITFNKKNRTISLEPHEDHVSNFLNKKIFLRIQKEKDFQKVNTEVYFAIWDEKTNPVFLDPTFSFSGKWYLVLSVGDKDDGGCLTKIPAYIDFDQISSLNSKSVIVKSKTGVLNISFVE